ncbi:MAG: efflux RND transporter periplasmic adaptor subunit [Myxococcota bacterium]|nr:efflux RND transporter periplasmic adaptor subunit [Myxococcota bacterium]
MIHLLTYLFLFYFGCADSPSTQPSKPFVPERANPSGKDTAQQIVSIFLSIRAELAQDRSSELQRLSTELRNEWRSLSQIDDSLVHLCSYGLQSSDSLGEASDLVQARGAYQELSRSVIALISIYPSLKDGLFVFSCPMVEGYNKWVQTEETMANPYMGTAMLQCGMPAEFSVEPPAGFNAEPGHYTCSMHPSVQQDSPGLCPLCNMDLTFIDNKEAQSGTVRVDWLRRQKLGIHVMEISESTREKEETIYAQTAINLDELSIVSLRYSAWISKLYVSQKGVCVDKNDPLMSVYSPEVYAAQKEFLVQQSAVARQKLQLLGLSPSWIRSLRSAQEHLTIYASKSGCVHNIHVKEGEHIPIGKTIMELADPTPVLELRIFPQQAPDLEVGSVLNVKDQQTATVDLIDPFAADNGRTKRVRARFNEDTKNLLIGERIPVSWKTSKTGIFVPVDSVIFTGDRRVVFIDEGEDRLRPRDIRLGSRFGEWYFVSEGLSLGDTVVSSGVFLLASESRLRSSSYFWRGENE